MGKHTTCTELERSFHMTVFQTLIVLNLVFCWSTVNSLQHGEVVKQEKVSSDLHSLAVLQPQDSGDSPVGYDFTPVFLRTNTPEILVENNLHSPNQTHLNNSTNYFISSATPEPYSMMSMYGYVLSAFLLFVIWVVGTSGNFLVVYLVARNKQLQTPMNLFLVNLSVADFAMAGLGSPMSFIAAVAGVWPFGDLGCVIYGFGMALAGITSITTLMVLAFERFLMIARPFRAADIQNQHSVMFIISIWVYSLILTVPPLLGWASYGPEAAHISCSVNWETDELAATSYIVFLFAMGLVLPLVTILGSYIGILITIRLTGQSQSINSSATRRAELRVVGMVATMVASFMFAWSPYAIFSLLVAFSPSFSRSQLSPFLGVLPCIFAKSSSCYNPIIYVGLNTQFRAAWMKLFGLQRPRDDEANTALTLSATVGIPKGPGERLGSSLGDLSNRDVESTFISKQQKNPDEQKTTNSDSSNKDEEEGCLLKATEADEAQESTPLFLPSQEKVDEVRKGMGGEDTPSPVFIEEIKDQREDLDSEENRLGNISPSIISLCSADKLEGEEISREPSFLSSGKNTDG